MSIYEKRNCSDRLNDKIDEECLIGSGKVFHIVLTLGRIHVLSTGKRSNKLSVANQYVYILTLSTSDYFTEFILCIQHFLIGTQLK